VSIQPDGQLKSERDLKVRINQLERKLHQYKQTEKLVNERERIFNVLDTLPALICLLTPDHHVAFANKSFRESFGESLDRRCHEYMFGYSQPCEFCQAYKVIETGQTQRWECRTPDGQGTFEVFSLPFTDTDGSTLILEMDIDISRRKRVEAALLDLNENLERHVYQRTEELRQSKERYQELVETSNSIIMRIDKDLKITYMNEFGLKFFGYTANQLIGRNVIGTTLPAKDSGGRDLTQMVRDIIRHPSDYKTSVHQNILKSGELVWVSWTNNVTYDRDGSVKEILSIGNDISDLKKAEIIKDEFIGMVSHELKTPLTVVTGAINVVMTEGVPEAEKKSLLADAAWGAEAMADIVDNLLELSRSQSNRLVLQPVIMDIEVTVSRLVERWAKRSSKHRLSLHIQPGLPSIEADPLRIQRILDNLINNAVKYSPENRAITVSVTEQTNEVLFTVSDHGIGISPADIDKLFHPFSRLETQVIGSAVQGVGLGLVVCRRLVEAHGGRIWVDSKAGKGSIFSFAIPVGRHTAG
jgi:PAS domain S-box-containing protein